MVHSTLDETPASLRTSSIGPDPGPEISDPQIGGCSRKTISSKTAILGYLVLEVQGVSEGVLCSIFRPASRLERWCIARLMSPPHLGERDPEKWPKNALKGIVQGKFSAILRVLVLSDAEVLSTVLCTIFRVAT